MTHQSPRSTTLDDFVLMLQPLGIFGSAASGAAVVAANVVLVKTSLVPLDPIVRVVLVEVLFVPAEVCRTFILSPLLMVPVPEALVYVPPFTEYSPPEIEISTVVLIPSTVISLDSITVLSATPVRSLKVNGSTLVSDTHAPAVVLVKTSLTPPIVTVVFVDAQAPEAEVCLALTVWPVLTTPVLLV